GNVAFAAGDLGGVDQRREQEVDDQESASAEQVGGYVGKVAQPLEEAGAGAALGVVDVGGSGGVALQAAFGDDQRRAALLAGNAAADVLGGDGVDGLALGAGVVHARLRVGPGNAGDYKEPGPRRSAE